MVVQLGLSNVQIKGLFEEKGSYGLVMARAVFPPDKIFKFMSAHLKNGSRLVFQRGGQSEQVRPPAFFKPLRSAKYNLPMDCGSRFAEVYELVPRGTK